MKKVPTHDSSVNFSALELPGWGITPLGRQNELTVQLIRRGVFLGQYGVPTFFPGKSPLRGFTLGDVVCVGVVRPHFHQVVTGTECAMVATG